MLRYEELEALVEAAVRAGITKVRLTGGEPLVRAGVVELVARIAEMKGVEDVGLTTNGVLLAKYAQPLKEAGLKRINISIDSLQPEKYRAITRIGNLEEVLAGIEAAKQAGFSPLKFNVVLIGGINDDEIETFVDWTRREAVEVRFIELMPLGEAADWDRACFMPCSEVLRRIPELVPLAAARHGDVATRWALPGAPGCVGLIRSVHHDFCHLCNRIRITADGKLRPCLHADIALDSRAYAGRDLVEFIQDGIAAKPACHHINDDEYHPVRKTMNEIGG